MSMIVCNNKKCGFNYDGECLEVARRQLHMDEEGKCITFYDGRAYDCLGRVAHLLKHAEKEILSIKSDNSEEGELNRALIQGNINALEVCLHIIKEVYDIKGGA